MIVPFLAAAKKRLGNGSILPTDPEWDQVVLNIHGGDETADPYFATTKLQAPFNGNFSDLKGKTLTPTQGNPGYLPTIDVDGGVKFVSGAGGLDGGWLNVSTPTDFDFGTDDFTIEAFIKHESLPTTGVSAVQTIFSKWHGTNGYGFHCVWDGVNGRYYIILYGGGQFPRTDLFVTPSTTTYTHVCFGRSGSTLYCGYNGSVANSSAASVADSISVGGEVNIGRNPDSAAAQYFKGNIKGLRVTRGVCRYTATYVPPRMDYVEPRDEKGHKLYRFTGGNPSYSTTDKVFGPDALYFNGVKDFITVDGGNDFAFGMNDFTVEMRIKIVSVGGVDGIIDCRPDLTQGAYFCMYLNSGQIYTYVNTANQLAANISNGTWYHVAVCRSNFVTRMFINGALVSSLADTNNYICPALRPRIGTLGWEPYDIYTGNFYLDDMRVTKGVARYTAAFDPDLYETPDLGQPVDPYWNNVVLGMKMDGTDNGTVFHDEKGKIVTVTGNTVTKTATKKFGLSSAYFDGTGDYLSVPNSQDFNLSNQDFTVELWYNAVSIPSIAAVYDFLIARDNIAVTRGWSIVLDQISGKLTFIAFTNNTTSFSVVDPESFPIGAWTHVAACRTGSILRLFKNGNLISKNSNFSITVQDANVDLLIGSNRQSGTPDNTGNWNPNGYTDDIRITKGVGRYNDSFAINADPHYSNVVLHMPMNGLDDGTTFTDLSGKTVTRIGNTVTKTATKKFGTAAAYFDGTGDCLVLPASSDWNFGSDDFTVELWYYKIAGDTANTYNRLLQFANGDIFSAFGIYDNDSNGNLTLLVANASGNAWLAMQTGVLVGTGTWVHVAVTRTNDMIKLWVNGVEIMSYAVNYALYYNAVDTPVIGGQSIGTSRTINGYIDDLRITKGVARQIGSTEWNNTLINMNFDVSLTQNLSKYSNDATTAVTNVTQDATHKYGTYSAKFQGSGDYSPSYNIALVNAAYSNFWNSDFTIEAWIAPLTNSSTTNGSRVFFGDRNTGGGALSASFVNGVLSSVTLEAYNGLGQIFYSGALADANASAAGEFNHVALVRSGLTLKYFINGVHITAADYTLSVGILSGSSTVYIGSASPAYYPYPFTGFIDSIRVMSTAKYTSNFVPGDFGSNVFTLPEHPVPNFTLPTRAFPRA